MKWISALVTIGSGASWIPTPGPPAPIAAPGNETSALGMSPASRVE
jgi:hypothetical protein